MPAGQQNATAMVEAVAQQRLGMPLADALALPTGEFASINLALRSILKRPSMFSESAKNPKL